MSKYLENEFIELEKFERISVEKDDMDLGGMMNKRGFSKNFRWKQEADGSSIIV